MKTEKTIEENLKDFILSRFKSVREFTQYANIPYSTVNAILKRGVANSSVTNIIKICNVLNISADELANNKIVPNVPIPEKPKSNVEIYEIYQLHKFNLENKLNIVTLDSIPLTDKEAELIINAMEISIELIRKNRKKENK